MNREFKKAMVLHHKRYPAMEAADWCKLAYQSAMGPGHIAQDFKDARDGVIRELDQLPEPPRYSFDPVAGGLARLHLQPAFDLGAAALLARLFIETARRPHGGQAALENDLYLIERHLGAQPWLHDYRAAGCPAVHHSPAFRAAYAPHYRLVLLDYAVYFPLLWRITRLLDDGRPHTVAIDGPCGSGKTHLADIIAQVFPCEVVHTDDFYLPFSQRNTDWESHPAGNMDLTRLREQVLLPVSRGETAVYRPYNCLSDTFGDERLVPGGGLTLLEGSYSHHPDLRELVDFRLFLTCSDAEQRARLEHREGMNYFEYATRWVPMERRYYDACHIPQGAHLTVDTTDFFRIQ